MIGHRKIPAVALLAASLVLAAACSSGSSGSARGPAGPADPNASFAAAGVLLGPSLDPYTQLGPVWAGLLPTYDTLLRATPDLSVEPNLVTEWEYSSDGKTLTFELRDDVSFTDGTPLDSQAVVQSLDRALELETSQVARLLTSIESVSATDEDTVTIALNAPDYSLLLTLSSVAGMVINPKYIDDDKAIAAGKPGVGSGAYTVARYVPNETVEFTKNENYWDKEVVGGAPKTYEYDQVADVGARLNGLLSSQYQAVQTSGIDSQLRQEAERNSDVLVTKVDSLLIQSLYLSTSQEPLDSPEVRQAIAHAIDLPNLVPNVLVDASGCSTKPLAQLWPVGHWAYDADIAPADYDPKLARKLLAQAGYADGFTLNTVAGLGGGFKIAAQAFQAQLKEVGIDMKIEELPIGDATQSFVAGASNSLILSVNAASLDPAAQIEDRPIGWNLVDHSPAGEELRAAAEKGKSLPTQEERAEEYMRISQIMDEQKFLIPFCATQVGYGHTAQVSGFKDSGVSLFGQIDPRTIRVSE